VYEPNVSRSILPLNEEKLNGRTVQLLQFEIGARLGQLPNELANQPVESSIRRFFFRLSGRRIRRRTITSLPGAARGLHRVKQLLLLFGREHLLELRDRVLRDRSTFLAHGLRIALRFLSRLRDFLVHVVQDRVDFRLLFVGQIERGNRFAHPPRLSALTLTTALALAALGLGVGKFLVEGGFFVRRLRRL